MPEVVAQDHTPVFQALGKNLVILQLWAQPGQGIRKNLVLLQLRSAKILQRAQAGAGIGLGKQHVKPQHINLVLVKQPIDHVRQLVARPGPMALLQQTFLVNVDNHNARVDAAWHGPLQAHVVGVIFQAVHKAQIKQPHCAGQRQHNKNQAQTHAHPMNPEKTGLLHRTS
ncbi:hypothetical protein GALL_466610 [mine drainage metagenome]|uniref:Uncharacterized protein n=1 Tax=mine drainage metagenome TaxID=410659 RepID=A0A1J5PLN7_9ZZZZ